MTRRVADKKPRRRIRPQWTEPGYAPSYLPPAFCGYDAGKSAAWAYGLIRDGELAAVRLHGTLRVPREAWAEWKRLHVEPAIRREAAS